jgi:hypothetical protein
MKVWIPHRNSVIKTWHGTIEFEERGAKAKDGRAPTSLQKSSLPNRSKSNLLTTTKIEKRKLIFAISDSIIVNSEIFRIFEVLLKIDNFLVGG